MAIIKPFLTGFLWMAGLFTSLTGQNSPNVLYIFTDDQTIRTLSCYSEARPWVNTPHIDRLAENGVKFKYAYTGAKCVPSRGNALTGMFQHHYTRETEYWPVEFRRQGYYTGMIGKWHWNIPRHDETWDWSAVWEHYLPGNEKNYYWDQSLRINNDTLMELEQYSTDAYTDLGVRFINERAENPRQPWFLWLCYGGVHGPHTPADRHADAYANEPEIEYPADVFGPRYDKPEHVVNLSMNNQDPKTGKPVWKKRPLDSWVKQYNEAVLAIDDGVGRLVEALEKIGQFDNTVIIFTSDNGFSWGHHGYNLKIAPYDATNRTPLIFMYPGKFPAGMESRIPVNGVDIVATIHALCHIEPVLKLDGRDLSPILYNPVARNLDYDKMIQIYSGFQYGNEQIRATLEEAHQSGDWSGFLTHRNTGTKAWMMLLEGRYKYIRHIYQNYIEELYDLESDPEELVNLAVRKDHQDLLRTMRASLLEEFAKSGSTFLDLLPEPLEKIIVE